jgi:hypothetical protein
MGEGREVRGHRDAMTASRVDNPPKPKMHYPTGDDRLPEQSRE